MTLSELFTNIANAIRGKDGTTATIAPTDFASRISAIETSQTPSISVSSSGLITATSGDKNSTKQLTTQAAKTVTPSTSSQIAVASGQYTTGDVTVAGDSNLVSSNIKSGISIFGVSGTMESSTTPISEEIIVESTASAGYVTFTLSSQIKSVLSCIFAVESSDYTGKYTYLYVLMPDDTFTRYNTGAISSRYFINLDRSGLTTGKNISGNTVTFGLGNTGWQSNIPAGSYICGTMTYIPR